MTNTPPRIDKRGAMPAVVTLAITGLVFTSIPLAQWFDGMIDRKDNSVQEVEFIPHKDEVIVQEVPKEEPKKALDDIKPPSIEDLVVMASKLDIKWATINTGTGINKDGFMPKGIEDIVDSSMLDTNPRPITRVRPNYADSQKGRVDILLIVNERGIVTDASVRKSSHPLLSRIALNAARQWRFEPGYVNGRPTKFKVMIPFLFNGK